MVQAVEVASGTLAGTALPVTVSLYDLTTGTTLLGQLTPGTVVSGDGGGDPNAATGTRKPPVTPLGVCSLTVGVQVRAGVRVAAGGAYVWVSAGKSTRGMPALRGSLCWTGAFMGGVVSSIVVRHTPMPHHIFLAELHVACHAPPPPPPSPSLPLPPYLRLP